VREGSREKVETDTREHLWKDKGMKKINEMLHDLYSTSNNVTVIKMKIRWTGHAKCMGQRRKL
jgi:hypothetical protein